MGNKCLPLGIGGVVILKRTFRSGFGLGCSRVVCCSSPSKLVIRTSDASRNAVTAVEAGA
jgi:hypothetical protein